MEIEKLIIFGIVNFLVMIPSGASGGGAGLVTTPFMVLLGLPPATAIATAKFNGLGVSAGASGRFYREKIVDRRQVIIFSIFGGITAILGSLLLSHFRDNAETIQALMGFAILFVGIPALYFRDMGLVKKERSTRIKTLGLLLLCLVVLLQTVIGTGVGSLNIIVLMACFGMTAMVASATRRAMQLVIAAVSLIVFMLVGLIDYQFGIVAFITSASGGYLGAHIALKKGNKFVRNIFAVLSAIMAIQLILSL